MVMRAIGRVADSYKTGSKKQRGFRQHGAFPYDARVLSFQLEQQKICYKAALQGVVVQLVEWEQQEAYDRTGLESERADILAVPIRLVTLPLNPGKNITVISVVVAMSHLLRYSGIDSAASFNARLKDAMAPVREYLEEDYE